MQQKIKLALLAALSLLMFSCGDSGNTTPETPIDYFSVKDGDHFIYNSYELDANNQENFTGTDSAYVGAKINWSGQQGNPVTLFSFDSQSNSFSQSFSYKQYSTKEQVFFSGNFLSSVIGSLVRAISNEAGDAFNTLDNTWAKIIDLSKDSFSILPKNLEITGITLPDTLIKNMPVNPGKITLDMSYNADVIKQPSQKFYDKMNNKSVNAVTAKISHKLKISIKFEKAVLGLKELPLINPNIKLEQYVTFAESIGLVKLHLPNQKISLGASIMGMEMNLMDLPLEGFGFTLLRYKKAK